MEQNGTHFAENLTQRQLTALPHLLRPGSLSVQARHAGVGRTTLYRWLQDENFRECLEWLRKETMRFTQAQLQAMSYKAAAVLDDALDDHDTRIRLQAARLVLDQAHNAQRDQTLHSKVENLIDAVTLMDDPMWRPR